MTFKSLKCSSSKLPQIALDRGLQEALHGLEAAPEGGDLRAEGVRLTARLVRLPVAARAGDARIAGQPRRERRAHLVQRRWRRLGRAEAALAAEVVLGAAEVLGARGGEHLELPLDKLDDGDGGVARAAVDEGDVGRLVGGQVGLVDRRPERLIPQPVDSSGWLHFESIPPA